MGTITVGLSRTKGVKLSITFFPHLPPAKLPGWDMGDPCGVSTGLSLAGELRVEVEPLLRAGRGLAIPFTQEGKKMGRYAAREVVKRKI